MCDQEGCRELERQRVKCVRGSEKQGKGEREKHVTELEMEGLSGRVGETATASSGSRRADEGVCVAGRPYTTHTGSHLFPG